MKKVLFSLSILLFAVSIVSAQTAQLQPVSLGTKCSNGCSEYDPEYGYSFCLPGFVDCLNDNNNCGSVGNSCSIDETCEQGTCQCFLDPDLCFNHPPIQPSQQPLPPIKTFVLKTKHNDITAMLVMYRHKNL